MPGNRTSNTMQLGEWDLPLFKKSSADLNRSTFKPAASSKIRNFARRESSPSIIAIEVRSMGMSYCQRALEESNTGFSLLIVHAKSRPNSSTSGRRPSQFSCQWAKRSLRIVDFEQAVYGSKTRSEIKLIEVDGSMARRFAPITERMAGTKTKVCGCRYR